MSHDASDATLSGPGPRRVAAAMAQWRRRSRLIRFYRRALPVAIGLIFLTMVGWVSIKGLLANLPNLNPAGATIRVKNPQFHGQDDHGRSFTIGGAEAVRQRIDNKEVIQLFSPVLKLATGPEKSLSVDGRLGTYDQASKSVRLTGNVHLVDTGSKADFQTGEALIDTKTGNVTGNSPVTGKSPLGAVSASSYAIYDHGARMEFSGNVRSRIEQRSR
ncbi:MAG: LPS export ABC transporter periplasmic protein LptC [Proteobacteria bacterium]|nr:LPS export ABC transporter periplasmic protein LptC [Pseudomonadota bacterium]